MKRRARLALGLLASLAGATPAPLGAAPPSASPSAGEQAAIDRDLRGLLMQVDEAERAIKASPLVIRDPQLSGYVRAVLCRTVGEAGCAGIRLYVLRTPAFNASIAPNGMMLVYSGLLLRMQNEAQFAAVLGHEYTHYERGHSLKLYRDAKAKSAEAAWLAFTGVGLIASLGLASSLFQFSRDMEREADAGGLARMAAAGYDTRQAAAIWEQLRDEMDATAAARGTPSRKDKDRGLFADHPPSAERVATLRALAAAQPGVPGATGADAWRRAMAAWWPMFLDDQLKRNDFGAGEYLLSSMAADGWAPWLLYARGELYRRRAAPGDLDRAIACYDQAIAAGGALPELWRGRGLARLKAGAADPGRADLAEYLRRAPEARDRALIAMMAGGS